MPIIADMNLKRSYIPISRSSSVESVDIDTVTIERICADDELRVAFLMFLQTCLDAASIAFIVDVITGDSICIHHILVVRQEEG